LLGLAHSNMNAHAPIPRKCRRGAGILSAAQVAAMPGIERSVAWFWAHYEELRAEGFPAKDQLLGGWHRSAVQEWLDRRAGKTAELPRNPLVEALNED
jgi:predicted DNA-binding transcriptional regulator AlpA